MSEQELALKIKAQWKYLKTLPGVLSGTPYSIWESPDGKFQVQIHDADNELVCVFDVGKGRWMLNLRDVKRLMGISEGLV